MRYPRVFTVHTSIFSFIFLPYLLLWQFWCLITVYIPWQALLWQFLLPEIIVTPLAESCLLVCLDAHSEPISILFLCPLQPRGWQNECHSARGRQKHQLYFQMLPLLPCWQMEKAGLACQTWHNSSLNSSKILAMLKPVACCPSPSSEPSFWHHSGEGEAQDGLIKLGGHGRRKQRCHHAHGWGETMKEARKQQVLGRWYIKVLGI